MNWIEILGYVASFLVAISLMMSSIVRLRWLNLAGGITFSTYGFIIEAYPVAAVNAFIACINCYFLYKIYNTQVLFNVIRSSADGAKEGGQSGYIRYFLEFFAEDIQHFYPGFSQRKGEQGREYYLLTDQERVVGVLSGLRRGENHFEIDLDLVVPAYRDYKLGHFLFAGEHRFAKKFGFTELTAKVQTSDYQRYLEKVGFKPDSADIWRYQLK